ncbi:hypothetical protein DNI29_16270 [Hymenobacter sediminis]|uniref:hypothetical protein n=1 Tax=Hymenobacter sediminis TaxID=2218621 RepID=UPI000DA6D288|nr:hypothetical protein [Hymenobacter sediminis]RPD45712.1 hypothetical protein DNI29_16270 [Hymenobacter sediminis]
METQPKVTEQWQANLNEFFATVDRENQAFSHNLTRQGTFYTDVARPALEAAAQALHQHGRTCETGLDQNRIYLIVHRPEGPVEFQYAVVAEARVETVTPYIHCWFEENELDDKPANNTEDEQDADKDGQEQESQDEPDSDEAQGDQKDDKKPTRTKTIELLSTWTEGREIESVTREEILADFVAHYQEAVTRLRTHLHIRPQ